MLDTDSDPALAGGAIPADAATAGGQALRRGEDVISHNARVVWAAPGLPIALSEHGPTELAMAATAQSSPPRTAWPGQLLSKGVQ